ncbi:MAG: RluA family pseudouridine synthase [Hyphomicrobiales bacterium]
MPDHSEINEAHEALSEDLVSDITEKRIPLKTEILETGERYTFEITQSDAGMRLDAFLPLAVDGFSRSRLQDIIKSGNATVNTKSAPPKIKLKQGDCVVLLIPLPEDPTPQGEDIPLDIVFEDDDLIVVNKPTDMVVHPAAGNWTGTLVNALIHHCGDSLSGIGGVRRPGIVHRLDKETSGLLIVAKNDHTHQGLAAQFADHGRTGPLRRAYKAIVWNTPSRAKGTIQTQLGRAPNNRLKIAVVEKDGREAITHYDVVETYGRDANKGEALASLVTCHLETGRTHQIRVHMTHIGCPLIGDPVYGTGFATKSARMPQDVAHQIKKLGRQALHAFLLEIEHPRTGETLSFESPLPKDLQKLANTLKKHG